jgi:hypothetical protein
MQQPVQQQQQDLPGWHQLLPRKRTGSAVGFGPGAAVVLYLPAMHLHLHRVLLVLLLLLRGGAVPPSPVVHVDLTFVQQQWLSHASSAHPRIHRLLHALLPPCPRQELHQLLHHWQLEPPPLCL